MQLNECALICSKSVPQWPSVQTMDADLGESAVVLQDEANCNLDVEFSANPGPSCTDDLCDLPRDTIDDAMQLGDPDDHIQHLTHTVQNKGLAVETDFSGCMGGRNVNHLNLHRIMSLAWDYRRVGVLQSLGHIANVPNCAQAAWSVPTSLRDWERRRQDSNLCASTL